MTVSFDELLQKAKEVALTAGKIAGDVVGEVVDTSKAKLAEAKLGAQIAEVNERLGMIVYETAKTGKESARLQDMLVKELDTLYQTLETLRKKTAPPASATEVTCPQCGEKNPAAAVFCSKCGCKLPAATDIQYAVEADIMDVTDEVEADLADIVSEMEAIESKAAEEVAQGEVTQVWDDALGTKQAE